MNLFEKIRTQIFGEALTCDGGTACAEQSAHHRKTGDKDHECADNKNKAVSVCDERFGKKRVQHKILFAIKSAVYNDGH